MYSSLYIHIPYCRKRCIYCDFYSAGARQADWRRLTDALLAELRARCDELTHPVDTIYLGGGTPSMLPPELMAELLEGSRSIIGSDGIVKAPEVTLEVNPEDVTEEAADVWKTAGVNRVSVGLQSFSDEVLRGIGRQHSSEHSHKALRILKQRFANVSGDLIFGLPGQTLDILEADLDALLSYGPEHVSVYSLMYEERTALTALRDAGRITEADETDTAAMYRLIASRLREAGYAHYEISNYARPGFESRHNSGYWTGRQYLGLGPSAHSYDGQSIRRANPADIRAYLDYYSDGIAEHNAPFHTIECLSEEERFEERVMLGLRTREGIDLAAFRKDFGDMEGERLLKRGEVEIKRGLLEHDGEWLRLTDEGIMVSDSVILSLI